MKRRQVVRGVTAVATGGLVTATIAGGGSVSVSDFTAHDSHIRTTDGSVTAVTAETTFEVTWEGVDGGADLSLTLTAENVADEESATVQELTDVLDATNGTQTYDPGQVDLLSTAAFETADFEAPEGETKETEIRYELTAAVGTESEEDLSVTATDTAIVTVEHVSDPRIESVELVDESNPQIDRVTVQWSVSDPDGNLDEVISELRPDGDTMTLASQTTTVDGSNAEGEHDLESDAGGPYEVLLTVRDTDGNTDTETKPFGTAEELDGGDTGFESLTAEVTATRGSNDAPSEVTFEYALDDAEPHSVQFALEIDGSLESELVEGTGGTVTVGGGGGGGQPPDSSVATVTGDIDGGERCSGEITADDGVVVLCG